MTGAVGYIRQSLAFLHGSFRDALTGQSAAQLQFVPEGESHSVAWVLWHAARVEDMLVHSVFQGGPDLWRQGDWSTRTALPARGFGTGQTTDEARAIQIADLDAFADYQAAVHAATDAFLADLSDADLERTVQMGDKTETLGESITLHLITHLNGHRGEINLIRGMHGLPPVMPNRGG